VNVGTKEQSISGCTCIHQTSQKSLKNVCQKADDNCFLGQERSSEGGIDAARDQNVRSVLQNTKETGRAIRNKRC
jgi:hypothetical protein